MLVLMMKIIKDTTRKLQKAGERCELNVRKENENVESCNDVYGDVYFYGDIR